MNYCSSIVGLVWRLADNLAREDAREGEEEN
jgi:hypothetical protein